MFLTILVGLNLGTTLLGQLPKTSPVLTRTYSPGEHLTYKVSGTSEDRVRTIHYSATADGLVKQDSSGHYYEEFVWQDLVINRRPQELTPASAAFRQLLSLSADYMAPIPDVSQVQPLLVGPITDLLNAYVDLKLAMGLPNLRKARDSFTLPLGRPNSWADGHTVLLGQNSFDLEVTLKSIDKRRDEAEVVIRHVPPDEPKVEFPAEWMKKPANGKFDNNWIEITQNRAGDFTVAVGAEVLVDTIRIRLTDGAILSVEQDDEVNVIERECADTHFAESGKPIRYKLHRQVSIRS